MAKSSKNMTTALWNIKSSSRSYCAELAHSWPHLLLGYPVERRGRLGPPGQKGFPSRDTLSHQWEMLPLLTLLSCVRSVTYKDPGLKRNIRRDLLLLFTSFSYVWLKNLPALWRLLLLPLKWRASFRLPGKHRFVFFLTAHVFQTKCYLSGST